MHGHPPHGYQGHQQYQPGWAMAPPGVWQCPFCRQPGVPRVRSKVSTGGWIMFALLVLVCFIFCWIGLLMTEVERFCPQCGSKVG